MLTKETISEWFKTLQDDICKTLERADEKGIFSEDAWERAGGGGGRTRVLTDGNIIEKGGVNFSAVHGAAPESILKAFKLDKADFYACGVSIVLHPFNPMMPIIHMNVRYFEMTDGTWWFGGGIDLTPHYVDKADAKFFHQQVKAVCDRHDPDFYSKFKKWADDYFYIPHRQETRGVGGIFFDQLGPEQSKSKAALFDFVKDLAQQFSPIYTHFMRNNSSLKFGEKEKQWQLLRRGRYVEFNLVWDRGTKFGLDTGGRTESILMSLPPQANWVYDAKHDADALEGETLKHLKKGIDWA